MKLNLPTGVTVALAAAAGIVVAFVGSGVIVVEGEWNTAVQTGVTILAVFGISPLTGASFAAFLHLSQAASTAIAGVLGALVVILAQIHMSANLHGVLAGLIAFAAGLGFAPAVGETVTRLTRPPAV